MPTHPDMPQGWQEYARRRSAEVTQAVEQARTVREQNAAAPLDQLGRRRAARLAAQEAARARLSIPPPPPTAAA
jgi:hypothetical protein